MLVCPQGFVSDHLEVVYDLDIEARAPGRGGRAGLRPHPRRSTTTRRCSARWPTASAALAAPHEPSTPMPSSSAAGITGLVAARELALGGRVGDARRAGPLGGKLRTTPFDGGALDEAADAFLARVPEGIDSAASSGIDGDLVSPAARRAHVWSRGALRRLPEAQVLGVPDRPRRAGRVGHRVARRALAAGRAGPHRRRSTRPPATSPSAR